MYGYWRSFEHFSYPESSPEATSTDLDRIEQHARENWTTPAKRPVIGSQTRSEWVLEYRVDPDGLHRQSDSQRTKYDRARRGGSRGNLGPIPPQAELTGIPLDLDSNVDPQEAWNEPEAAALLAELPRLQRASIAGRRSPYKFLVLRWAIDRAVNGSGRLVPFRDVQKELAAVLAPDRIASSAPKPADPWFALRSSSWWDLQDVPLGAAESIVRTLNLRGGLSAAVYERVTSDPAFTRAALEQLDGLIAESQEGAIPAPADSVTTHTAIQGPRLVRAELIPVESNVAESFLVSNDLTEAERSRRESLLQNRYRDYLLDKGHDVQRYRITTEQGAQLVTDLFDVTEGELIEVKADVDRNTLRLALGQILDYARFLDARALTLLVPERPSPEMVKLLAQQKIGVAWPEGSGFHLRDHEM